MTEPTRGLRHAVLGVAVLNFGYFWVELGVAQAIGSVSLLADSIDFLEDTAVNLLILLGLSFTLAHRARLGFVLAGILLLPSIATLWMAWHKFISQVPPDPIHLSATGLGALIINLICAFLLARFRNHQGSLTRAAFLSARNDALANLAIITAGMITLASPSALPDLIVGLGIFLMNLDAARAVFRAARQELAEAKSPTN